MPGLVSFFAAIIASLALATAAITACGPNNNSDDSTSISNGNTNTASNSAPDTSATPTRRYPDPEPFKLGYIMPETGNLAFIAQGMIQATRMAVQDITAADYQLVELLRGDSAVDPNVAAVVVDRHLSDGVHGIVGAVSSAISLSIIDKLVGAQIPMVSPANGAPSFSDYDDNGYYFRTSFTDLLQAPVLSELIIEDGGTDVGIMFLSDEYGRGLATAVKDNLEASGANIAAFISYDPASGTFQAEIQELADAGVDSVMLIPFEEGGKILAQMIEAGIGPADINIYVPASFAVSNIGERIDPANPAVAAGIKGTRPTADPTVESDFEQRLTDFANKKVEPVYSHNSYDAVVVMALAALMAESNDPADYRDAINGVTRGGTKCTSYAQCAKLAIDGHDIDYDGESGPLEFLDIGEPATGYYHILEYDETGQAAVVDFTTSTLE